MRVSDACIPLMEAHNYPGSLKVLTWLNPCSVGVSCLQVEMKIFSEQSYPEEGVGVHVHAII